MPRRKSAPSPDADDRFRMDVPADMAEAVTQLLLDISRYSQDHPLAAMRIALKMQGNLRTIERDAAVIANSRYKISWTKIGELFGRSAQWAWERYIQTPRKAALEAEIRLAKLSKAEVEEQPKGS